MAANIQFYTDGTYIDNLSGSGLGFYGSSGFGSSIAVGAYNGRTYITDSNGTTLGPEGNNVQFLNSASGILGQAGSGIHLNSIPNSQATLNVRFVYDSPVRTLNGLCYFYDRVNINNDPSGITIKCHEVIHPNPTQVAGGSGLGVWSTPHGSGVTMSLATGAGPSGLNAGNGSNSTYSNVRHDNYLLISVSPNSIGAKTFSLWCQQDYL